MRKARANLLELFQKLPGTHKEPRTSIGEMVDVQPGSFQVLDEAFQMRTDE